MPRQALKRETHSDDTKIEQPRQIQNQAEREEGEIILVDQSALKKEHAERLAFMEEPVTIRIEPGSEENAPQYVMLCVNGRGCEYLINGKWKTAVHGWISIGEVITIKRKYLEVLARSKIDRIETIVPEMGASEADLREGGKIRRFTRQNNAFSVLEDKNPRGAAWLTSVIRRNL
jgi:hypothetical protein